MKREESPLDTESVLFSLIRSELTETEFPLSPRERSAELLQNLYCLSNRHDLAHLIAAALSKAGWLGNDEISEKFTRKAEAALCRDTLKEITLTQIGDCFHDHRIPFLLLKGAELRSYYPEPWQRTGCDVDLLVSPNDAISAVDALCSVGFLKTKDTSTHDYALLSPNRVPVEVHFSLLQEGLPNADAALRNIRNNVRPSNENPMRYEMTAEDRILYHVAHMARHIRYGGCGIRPFLDLWLLQKAGYRQEILDPTLGEAGLKKIFDTALALSRVWLENGRKTEETTLLAEFILSGGSDGSAKNAAKLSAANGEGKFRSFLNAAFLPPKNLAVLYPKLKKYPFLFPFYQIRRWTKIFDRTKRQKLKSIASAQNSVTQAERENARRLLDSLGLYSDRSTK